MTYSLKNAEFEFSKWEIGGFDSLDDISFFLKILSRFLMAGYKKFYVLKFLKLIP